ncbi:MAG TPA: carboxypeptidase regulatory-like domain-containing protein [Thermoanaerobaculia bacterium]|nr:carboxypeptidase regulatory-like domain-containing protein [Thermoanaerobaculia bacterium]
MKSINLWGRIVAVAALLLLVAGGSAFAQLQTGNLYGTVTDDQGAALPGVTVTLTGSGAPQVQVTNAQGQFRFLGLGPGQYDLRAELEGFSTIDYPNIVINIGRNTQIEVKLSAAVEDVITVTAESPLLDERRISTGATVSQTELEKIPTSRDPWAVLQTTPGVLTDRINVGGNESGQQSQYVGPGSGGDQAVWSVDGVVITDMAALGSSPAYYDFDSFEEMQVTTGGSDTSIATGGVVLNMVTKRGTNEWRGTGRYYLTDDQYQSDLDFDNSDLGAGGPVNTVGRNINPVTGAVRDPGGPHPQALLRRGNRIVSVEDYGAEIGGPIVKDRLWVWGSYADQKVDLLTISDVSDFTDLKTANVKLNAQIAANNSATGFALNSNKVKEGRNAGPTRPQETTWNQQKFGDDPTAAKIEDTHIFSSNFYLTGLYSIVNGGFELAPQGGLNATSYWDENQIWHNTFLLNQTLRPQTQYKADASNFFNTGSLSHELKFGAGFREAEVDSLTRWGGLGVAYNGPGIFGTSDNVVGVARDGNPDIFTDYTQAYLQDTLTVGNLTANLGVRYDRQGGENKSRTVRASPALPNILPQVNFQGGDIGFEWTNVTPRLGLTYALGAERKTLLRASYSQFADQLGAGNAGILNTIAAPSYVYFYTQNQGTGNIGVGELDLTSGASLCGAAFCYSGNVNPNTGLLLQSNGVNSDLEAPLTDELLLGVEHALLPEFVVGLNLTYRKITNILENELLVFEGDPYSNANLGTIGRTHRRSDYVLNHTTTRSVRVCTNADCSTSEVRVVPLQTPDGKPYSLDFYQLRAGLTTRGGVFLDNGDREQEYTGASLVFNKRLANRWMLRGNVTWSDWNWSSVPDGEIENPTRFLGGGSREGDPVLQGSGAGSGAKGGVYINSEWAYSVNGLYQIAPERPWGFNAAINLQGRQGYPIPYFQRVIVADPNQRVVSVQVTDRPDTYRLDDIHILDARVEKEFTFSDFGLTLGVDVFNVLNEAFVQQRQHRLGIGTSDHVTEVTSPRILRFGARISFR